MSKHDPLCYTANKPKLVYSFLPSLIISHTKYLNFKNTYCIRKKKLSGNMSTPNAKGHPQRSSGSTYLFHRKRCCYDNFLFITILASKYNIIGKYACLSLPRYPLGTVCQYLHMSKFPQYLQFWYCTLAHNSTCTTKQPDLGMKIFTCERSFIFFVLKTPQELLLKILPVALQRTFSFIAFKIYIIRAEWVCIKWPLLE